MELRENVIGATWTMAVRRWRPTARGNRRRAWRLATLLLGVMVGAALAGPARGQSTAVRISAETDALDEFSLYVRQNAPTLTEGRRVSLLSLLREGLLDRGDVLPQTSARGLHRALLAGDLLGLSAADQARYAATWMATAENLDADSTADLRVIVDLIAGQGESLVPAASGRLGALCEDLVRGLTITPHQPRRIVQHAGLLESAVRILAPDAAARVSDLARARLANAEAARLLFDRSGARAVHGFVHAIDDMRTSGAIYAAWIENGTGWRDADPWIDAAVYRSVSLSEASAAGPARAAFRQVISGDLYRMIAMGEALLAVGSAEVDELLAEDLVSAVERYVRDQRRIEAPRLLAAMSILDAANADGAVRERMTAHLAAFFESGGVLDGTESQQRETGSRLSGVGSIDRIAAAVAAENGDPRLDIVNLITGAYEGSPRMHDWRDALEGFIDRYRDDAELRAAWLFARGIAADGLPIELSLTSGLEWMELAAETTRSEQTRWRVVEWVARHHEMAMEPRAASDRVRAASAGFSSPELRQQAAEMAETLDRIATIQADIARLREQLGSLEARVRELEASPDPEDIELARQVARQTGEQLFNTIWQYVYLAIERDYPLERVVDYERLLTTVGRSYYVPQ